MAFAELLQRYKARKCAGRFAELVERNELEEAIAYYEISLARLEVHLDRPLRAVYHFCRWLSRREERDWKALESFAADPGSGDVLDRTYRIALRLRREMGLADALRKRDLGSLSSGGAPALTKDSEDLEKLALAMLESCELARGLDDRMVAAAVQRNLPDGSRFQDKEKRALDLLLIWSAWHLDQYSRFVDDEIVKDACRGDMDQMGVQNAALSAWGKSEISVGRLQGARRALAVLDERLEPESVCRVALAWGIEAFKSGDGQTAIEWFDTPSVVDRMKTSIDCLQPFLLARALAYYLSGTISAGHRELQSLYALGPDDDTRAVALFVQGLALIAEIRNLADPASKDCEDEHEIRMRNRVLWSENRVKLEVIVGEIGGLNSRYAAGGPLLHGLAVYVDPAISLSSEQLNSFSEAIDSLGLADEQGRMREIEGALIMRAQATEQAIDCIARGDSGSLRVLQDQVLDPLGDAIPPLVRASVYITLWQADPDCNPIPNLLRLPRNPENESQIELAIRQVQVSQSLRALSELCRRPDGQVAEASEYLPALSSDARSALLGNLAKSVLLLRRGQWRAGLESVPRVADFDDGSLRKATEYIRFYFCWKLDELRDLPDMNANPYLPRSEYYTLALNIRQLMAALERQEEESVQSILLELLTGSDYQTEKPPLERFACAIIWLISHDHAAAASRLAALARRGGVPGCEDWPDREIWVAFLSALSAGAMGQFTACRDACSGAAVYPASTETGIALQMQMRLLKIEAELALLANTNEDIARRWPASRRLLQGESEELSGIPVVAAYGALTGGLVAFLSADTIVNEEFLMTLLWAEQELDISRHQPFFQQVIDSLGWRRRVIQDFWNSLAQNDFQMCRRIYAKEIVPIFEDRVPHSIQMGMIIVSWDAAEADTSDLLRQLSVLESEAVDLSPELTKKVKDYIVEGDMIRHFTKLLRENDFDGIIDLVEKSEWAQNGSYPVAVAIGLLYALYRKERLDRAEALAEGISEDKRLAGWVRDYGALIKGYLYFRQQNYPKAADAFGMVQTKELLGHNMEKYWAISHFSNGLQLLKVDQKKEAFAAFRRSLGGREAAKENASLAPLFLHFGLKNLEMCNGSQALQAFGLLKESLPSDSEDLTCARNRLVSGMGELLCRSLMAEEGRELPGGDDFLELVDQARSMGDVLSKADVCSLEYTLRRMAVVQELRKQRIADAGQQKDRDAWIDFLESQIRAMQTIEEMAESDPDAVGDRLRVDPTLRLLQALTIWYVEGELDYARVLEMLTQAVRLGLQSSKLVDLINRVQKAQSEATKSLSTLVDMFDEYLQKDSVPSEHKIKLSRSGEITALYRLTRNYTPRDIKALPVQSGADVIVGRIAHLVYAWGDCAGKSAGAIAQLREKLATTEEPKQIIRLLEEISFESGRQIAAESGPLAEIIKNTVEFWKQEKKLLSLERDLFSECFGKHAAVALDTADKSDSARSV